MPMICPPAIRCLIAPALALAGVAVAGVSFPAEANTNVLRVVTASTDVASLARSVGGERVQVFCLSHGPEDPHTLEIRPGQIRAVAEADLFIQVGLGLENAWLKDLFAAIPNPDLKPGGRFNLNLGRGVRPLQVALGVGIPGTFHEEGNPHYLLDPLEGMKAARTLRDRFGLLRPHWAGEFSARYDSFRKRLALALAGPECAQDQDLEEVVQQFEQAPTQLELNALLQQHQLGGWLKAFLPYRGRMVIGDHDLWPYFERRFGLNVLYYLEPSPGSPPTTRHLQIVVEEMHKRQIHLILTAPYFEPRHARFVAHRSGARILPMAHQTGGRHGTDDYVAMVRHNVEQVLQALHTQPATTDRTTTPGSPPKPKPNSTAAPQ